jgi:hypothetical protein
LQTYTAARRGIWIEPVYNIASGSSTVWSVNGSCYSAPAGTADIAAIGGGFTAFYRGTAVANQTRIIGLEGNCGIDSTSPTGTVIDAISIRAAESSNFAVGTPAVTFTNRIGLLVENMGSGHGVNGLTIPNAVGILIRNQTGAGSSNTAVQSDGGQWLVKTGANSVKGIQVRRNSSGQSAALFETQDENGNPLWSLGGNGRDVSLDTVVGTKWGLLSTHKQAWFGADPVVQQTGGVATAGATYTATEQGMLDRAYQALRAYGLLS